MILEKKNIFYSPPTYILFQDGTLATVVGIGHARTTANHASTLIAAIVALVTNAHQRARTHVRIANHTHAVTLFAQSSNRLET